jgi:hypothetical protein
VRGKKLNHGNLLASTVGLPQPASPRIIKKQNWLQIRGAAAASPLFKTASEPYLEFYPEPYPEPHPEPHLKLYQLL